MIQEDSRERFDDRLIKLSVISKLLADTLCRFRRFCVSNSAAQRLCLMQHPLACAVRNRIQLVDSCDWLELTVGFATFNYNFVEQQPQRQQQGVAAQRKL
jgi:hypothetical protein